MGAVDLVIQVESPKSVTRGLQRIGRAGHGLGEVSKGRIFPKFRADLLECAVVARGMREGEIEETVIPQNPLDVLAQHLVSMAALDEWEVDEVERLVTATEPFRDLSREQLENVLDMLDGRYPSDRFAELRPRIVWDRTTGTMHGRKGARQLVVTNAGTIPDRGLYGVHLPDGRRVGELDEEMVYEARPGQTFLLGATTWRIEEITRDRVIVTPAPGAPGAVPFWKGDGIGRPAELGRAIGAFAREAVSRDPAELAAEYDLDRRAAENLVAYLREQQQATRVVPSDETIVVERFRDEIGDWRLCILSPYGGRVHAAWGLALAGKIRAERDLEADAIWSDDGIVIHLPDADEPPPADLVLIEPDELEDLVVGELSGSALFGARFRENASRSLLIPRAYPGKRTPLWQQRLKSQSLLEVARDFPRFPVILETYRECLRDVLDLPSLTELLRDAALAPAQPGRGRDPDRLALRLLAALRLRRHLHVRGGHAERRAARGGAGARPRPAARAARPGGAARADRPRGAGGGRGAAPAPHRGRSRRRPRRPAAAAAQPRRPDRGGVRRAGRRGLLGRLDAGEAGRRAPRRRWSGSAARSATSPPRTPASTATRSACRRRAGLPETFLEDHPDAMRALVRRFARTHGPFPTARLAERYGVDPTPALRELEREGRPGPRRAAAGRDRARVVRLRRPAPGPPRQPRPPARARSRPPTATELARFLPSWQNVDAHRAAGAGPDRLREALVPLQGVALTPKVWEGDVLPRRLGAYSPTWLDELCTSGELVWIGAGARGPQRRPRRPLLPRGRPPRRPAARQRQAGAGRGRGPRRDPRAARRRARLLARPARRPRRLPGRGAAQRPLGPRLVAARSPTTPSRRCGRRGCAPCRRASAPGRRFARRRSTAGAAVQGRWSLTAPLFANAPGPGARLRAQAELMLERYGIVTRETVLAEGVPGGFSTLYAELGNLELLGTARRGYFVEGLGGAQFALPGAVERLRSLPEADGSYLVLAATDPANPYGASLPWPKLEGGRRPGPRPRRPPAAARRRAGRLRRARRPRHPPPAPSSTTTSSRRRCGPSPTPSPPATCRSSAIEKLDGEPVIGSGHEEALLGAGFSRGPRKLSAAPARA